MQQRMVRIMAVVLGLTCVGTGGFIAWHQYAIARDCGRVGEDCWPVLFCMPQRSAEPEIDWSTPERRADLWRLLSAPRWLIPHWSADLVRMGAAKWLLESVSDDDTAQVLRQVRRGNLSHRFGALLLALSTIDQGDDAIARARSMLVGDETERTLALLALPVLTGHRLEQERVGVIKSLPDGTPPSQVIQSVFVSTPLDLIAEWQEWFAQHAGCTMAELHRDMAARVIEADFDVGDSPELDLAHKVLRSVSLERFRARLGVASTELAKFDMKARVAWRRQQATIIRRANPTRLAKDELLSLHALRDSTF